MFGIDYHTWEEICNMYFHVGVSTQHAYLQWYPFSKLSIKDKEKISSKYFFEKYIASGAVISCSFLMEISDNYILKANGSFRDSTLVSPIIFLLLQCIGKRISELFQPGRSSEIDIYYAGNYEKMRPKYKKDYDDFVKKLVHYQKNTNILLKQI